MIYAPATALARQGALGVILGISAQALLVMSRPGAASACSTSCAVADLNPPMRVWCSLGARCSGGISRWIQNISGLPKDFSAALR
jgi:hypothetical protein